MEQELFSTQEAAKKLGIKPPAFRMKALRAGFEPAKVIQGKGKPQKFWTAKQIATIAGNARADVTETEGAAATVTPGTAEGTDISTIAPAPVVDTETLIFEPLDNKSLKQLADEANLYTKRGDDCIKLGLTFYFEAGRRLNEAKKRVGHGNWQNWLAQNFSASDDTANNYMKLARRFGEQKSETFRNLNPATAIKLLALPEGTEEEFIQTQAAAGKPVENQSARDVQKNVKAFKTAHATPKENAEEPTPDLSNCGEKFSLFGRETDEVTDADTQNFAELIIDEEFSNILPPLKEHEFNLLEENILRDGILDPLKVWNGILLDGHARYEIAKRHNLPFKIVEVKSVTDRDDAIIWIIKNQLARRSLNQYERAQIVLKLQNEPQKK